MYTYTNEYQDAMNRIVDEYGTTDCCAAEQLAEELKRKFESECDEYYEACDEVEGIYGRQIRDILSTVIDNADEDTLIRLYHAHNFDYVFSKWDLNNNSKLWNLGYECQARYEDHQAYYNYFWDVVSHIFDEMCDSKFNTDDWW